MTRLRRWLRRLLITLTVLALLAGGAWIFRWSLIGGAVRDALADAVADLGLTIEVEEFSGSLFGDVTALGVRIEPTTAEPHFVREGRVEKVHILFDLRGLLAGDDRWLEEIRVAGVQAVLDVRAPLPSPEPTEGGGAEPGALVLPSLVRILDVDISLRAGPSRIDVRGASLAVREIADEDWKGRLQARLVSSLIEGEADEFHSPGAEVEYVGGELSVVTGGGRKVIRADLSDLEGGHLEADLDLPLFGGVVTGEVRTDRDTDTMTANLVLDSVRSPRLLRFLPELPVAFREVSGTLEAVLANASTADLAGLSGTFRLTLMEPEVQRWSATHLEFSGHLENQVFELQGKTSGPDTLFHGRIRHGETPEFDATFTFVELDLAALGLEIDERDVRGTATGRAGVKGTEDAPTFSADLTIDGPGYGEWSADRLEVRGGGSLDDFTVDRFLAIRGRDRVTVEGRLTLGDTVQFTAKGDLDVQSADVIVGLCGVSYPDEVDAGVRTKFAAEPGPDGGTLVVLSDLVVTSPLLIAEGTGLTTRLPPLNGDFDPDLIAIEGQVAIRGVDAKTIAERIDADPRGEATATGWLKVQGTIGKIDATAFLEAKNVLLRPPERDEIHLQTLTILARHDGESLELTQLVAGSGDWGLVARGHLGWDPLVDPAGEILDARLEGEASLVDVPLSLTGRIPGLASATGRVNAEVTVGGTVGAPAATGTIDVVATELAPVDGRVPVVRDLKLGLSLEDGGLEGVRVVCRPSSARVLGARVEIESGGADLRFAPFRIGAPSLVARVRDIDAGTVGETLGATQALTGDLELDLTVSDGPRVDVVVRGGNFGLVEARRNPGGAADGTVDLRARWGPDGLTVTNGQLTFAGRSLRLDAEIPVSPTLDPPGIVRRDEAPIRIVASGTDLDLGELGRSFPKLRVGGRADLTATLEGTLGNPRGGAKLTVRDGFARYPGVPNFDGVKGVLHLRPPSREEAEQAEGPVPDALISVESLTFLLGRGELAVDPEGKVELIRTGPGGFGLGRMNLRIHGRDALLARTRTMLIRAAPDLTLTGGGNQRRLLEGRLDISSVRYTQRVELVSRAPALAPLPLTEDPFLSSLHLDVQIEAPRESIRVRNNLLDAEFGGRIRLLGTVALPRPEGRIVSDRGSVRLPTLTMKLVRGVAEFRRERPLQPYLDTLLAANINRITVDLEAKGPINDLEIKTRSLPPMPEEDVITLLATGQVPEDVEEGTAATMAATLLYRQLLSEMDDGDPDAETTTIEDLASRVEEFSVDTATLLGGGTPTWRATLRLDGEWLYLRGDQSDSFNYGLDFLFRLSFR